MAAFTRSFGSHFTVRTVPVLKDNYTYVVQCLATRSVAIVDVSETQPAIRALTEAAGGALAASHFAILSTHKHWDHSGGNAEMATKFPGLKIYGGANDSIPACTHPLNEGDVFQIGQLSVRTHHTPCHTSGHVLFHVFHPQDPANGAVFTGDTVFVGGIGAFFEGTAAMMNAALRKLAQLPDATAVYPGHEYTVNFLKFATDITKGDPTIKQKLQEYERLRSEKLPTVPSTVGVEKATNVFLMAAIDTPRIAAVLDMDGASDVTVMQRLYDSCP